MLRDLLESLAFMNAVMNVQVPQRFSRRIFLRGVTLTLPLQTFRDVSDKERRCEDNIKMDCNDVRRWLELV